MSPANISRKDTQLRQVRTHVRARIPVRTSKLS